MKIAITSDLHGYLPDIPECDLLLIAGDVCPVWDHNRQFQANWLRGEFSEWLRNQPAKSIVGVAGNHDFILQDWKNKQNKLRSIPWSYLYNESIVVALGVNPSIKIWGSPYSPTFGGWAFMKDDFQLYDIWQTIPVDTEIIIVHGPPLGYGDKTQGWQGSEPKHVGSASLRDRIRKCNLPNLKLVVCGHIHPAYGTYQTIDGVIVVNATHVTEEYEPLNLPIEIVLKEDR